MRLKAIVEFKISRKDELNNFRKYLSQVQNKIKNAEEREETKEILIDTKEDIQKSIHNISKSLSDAGIVLNRGKFSRFLIFEQQINHQHY